MWWGSSAISRVGRRPAASAVRLRPGRDRLVGDGDAVEVGRLRPVRVRPVRLQVDAVAARVGGPLAADVGGRTGHDDAGDEAGAQHPVGDVQAEGGLAGRRGGRGEEAGGRVRPHGLGRLLLPGAEGSGVGPVRKRSVAARRRRSGAEGRRTRAGHNKVGGGGAQGGREIRLRDLFCAHLVSRAATPGITWGSQSKTGGNLADHHSHHRHPGAARHLSLPEGPLGGAGETRVRGPASAGPSGARTEGPHRAVSAAAGRVRGFRRLALGGRHRPRAVTR